MSTKLLTFLLPLIFIQTSSLLIRGSVFLLDETRLVQDEAINGNDAIAILEDQRRPLYFIQGGREPLYLYAMSLVFKLLGPSLQSVRLTSVLFGMAALVLMFVFVRKRFDALTALAATFFLGFSWVHVLNSQIGIRAISCSAIVVLLWFLLSQDVQKRRPFAHAVLVGLVLGVGNYTYTNMKALILAAFFILLMDALSKKQKRGPFYPAFVSTSICFVIMIPMHIFPQGSTSIYTRTFDVMARGSEGSFSPVAVLINIGLLFSGIVNSLVNGPYTLMNPVEAIFLGIGIWACYHWRTKREFWLLIILIAFSFVPLVFSDRLSMRRGIAAFTLITILSGFGLRQTFEFARRRFALFRHPAVILTGFVGLGCLSFILGGNRYMMLQSFGLPVNNQAVMCSNLVEMNRANPNMAGYFPIDEPYKEHIPRFLLRELMRSQRNPQKIYFKTIEPARAVIWKQKYPKLKFEVLNKERRGQPLFLAHTKDPMKMEALIMACRLLLPIDHMTTQHIPRLQLLANYAASETQLDSDPLVLAALYERLGLTWALVDKAVAADYFDKLVGIGFPYPSIIRYQGDLSILRGEHARAGHYYKRASDIERRVTFSSRLEKSGTKNKY